VKSLHKPPSGARVEKNALRRYLSRVRTTRFEADLDVNLLKEKMPNKEQYQNYKDGMRRCFEQRPAPRTFVRSDIFDDSPHGGGRLRLDVFEKAYSHIKPDSSPGFPFHSTYSRNDEVPMDLLYAMVELLIQCLSGDDYNYEYTESDFLRHQKFHLYGIGEDSDEGDHPGRDFFMWPAHVFVKGQPTKISKEARLIFGVSLVVQIVGRIIFGDYLKQVVETWDRANHKVGMDMYTEEGVAKIRACVERLFANVRAHESDPVYDGIRVYSDDIQGWEYNGRVWMHSCWHHVYMEAAAATDFHRQLQTNYMKMEAQCFVMLSDGEILKLPHYIVLSGKITTHLQNSDERSALASMDAPFMLKPYFVRPSGKVCVVESDESIVNLTNGDDCITPLPRERPLESEKLGFVHTDFVDQDLGKINFSSQVFLFGSENRRIPDGIATTFFGAVMQDDTESRMGKLANLVEHPAVENYHALVTLCDLVPEWKKDEDVERRKVLLENFEHGVKRIRFCGPSVGSKVTEED